MANKQAPIKGDIAKAPLEVRLVFNVRKCNSCSYFWPGGNKPLPYGPYPTFDFLKNEPAENEPGNASDFYWIKGDTQKEGFPHPEVMDGCRKAPLMTIGINPNLTAFGPNKMGTSWCYPCFSSNSGTDEWTKYAYYYRYRSTFQEHMDINFVEKFLSKTQQVIASNSGAITKAVRNTDSQSFEITVRYQGEQKEQVIELQGKEGGPRWVVLFNPGVPGDSFVKGDIIAAQLDIPDGNVTKIFHEQIGYYQQIVPVLGQFETFLRQKGYKGDALQVGEDVCQLDMVACASPHWTPDFLGGTSSEKSIINNCVAKNAWALRQLIQTQPAVLFLVGVASYAMFRKAFGHIIKRDKPLPETPYDGAYTLLRQTTDNSHPCYINFSTDINGIPFNLKTRLVVTPHFSYDANFIPQLRLSPKEWTDLKTNSPDCAHFLQTDKRLKFVPGFNEAAFVAFTITSKKIPQFWKDVNAKFPALAPQLELDFYDPHQMMANTLGNMYDSGELSFKKNEGMDILTRGKGSCNFCVNDFWKFSKGCPYGNAALTQPAHDFYDKVADAIISGADQGTLRAMVVPNVIRPGLGFLKTKKS